MADDTLQKAAGNRGALEQIAMMIPGFQGYLKAEHRREADQLQREYLCRRLDDAREKVREAVEEWTDDNRFDNLELGTKVQDILQRVTSQVKNADQGYSGFFDTVQIGDAELEMLYETDKAMLGYVQEIEKTCTALDPEADDGDCKKALKAVRNATKELESAFAKREDTIKGVG